MICRERGPFSLLCVVIVGSLCAIASGDPKPSEPTVAALEAEADLAITELVANMRLSEKGANASRTRKESTEAMARIIQKWKKKLVDCANLPIEERNDNPQRFALDVLCEMSPDDEELSVLTRNLGTKSTYDVAIGDDPLLEYPFATALKSRSSPEMLFSRYRRTPPKEISDKEIQLAAEVLWSYFGRDQERGHLLQATLNFEIGRARRYRQDPSNIERVEKEWKRISGWDEPQGRLSATSQ